MANPSPRPEGLSPEQIATLRAQAEQALARHEAKLDTPIGRVGKALGTRPLVEHIYAADLLALCAMAEARHAPTPTCATCKHWQARTGAPESWHWPEYQGRCVVKVGHVKERLSPIPFDALTLATFGCTLHEPKPSEVTP